MGFSYSSRAVPYFGELETGDGFFIQEFSEALLVVIIDALGHGSKAAKLAREIEHFLEEHGCEDVEWLMTELHRVFLGSIGAAVTIVFFDAIHKSANGIGIGNTLVRQLASEKRSFPAQPGIVGEMLPTLRPFQFTFADGDVFMFTTDGIKENINGDLLPNANYETVESLSSKFIESFSKPYDDATAIAVRYTDG
ncbi:serine/threonine-protein phosphatase [Vibrio sp. Isolate23]|uniref:SpoIIE family protein phosphatase n=1 Tax=Vibrio sp. Isolate23 TaxID=2908533 RepID=UPI001EFDD8B0|nr:SpoIIE family protein phosphatase [Vibrio sp. Isolate23]MCG9681254.1 serine/threonine-protein phosphatase [Vibrio sp. Isolate23]